jgi:hypothetical protein
VSYDTWTTANGRKVKVLEMSDLYLLHIVRCIEQGRLFADASAGCPVPDNWLTVLKGEALRRGLDPTKAPSRKLGLFEWLMRELFKDGVLIHSSYTTAELAVSQAVQTANDLMARAGFSGPELDVSNLDDKVLYLHWQTGRGVGTPITE